MRGLDGLASLERLASKGAMFCAASSSPEWHKTAAAFAEGCLQQLRDLTALLAQVWEDRMLHLQTWYASHASTLARITSAWPETARPDFSSGIHC